MRLKLLPIVVLSVLLSGCAPDPGRTDSPSGEAGEPASPEVREALSDGLVTIDEYESAFRNYVACMKAAGFGVTEHDPDLNGVINYSISNDAVVNGVDENCYGSHYGPVDSAYQVANEDSGSSAEFLRNCLRENGIEPAETMEELLKQVEDEEIDLGAC